MGTDRTRILVTGVGGAPGFDLATRLLDLGAEVIGADADPLASGLLIDRIIPRVLPPATEPSFEAALTGLCRDLRPAGMFSTVEHELPQLLRFEQELAGLGVLTWLPPAHAIEACLDKAVFCKVLAGHGIPVPRTWLPGQISRVPPSCPLVVKPRRGQGSKNVMFCSTRDQARVLCELIPDPVIQERVDGQEFTADCLVSRDGRASVIVRHRLVVKGGLSMVSRTVRDDQAADLVRQALAVIGATGPCCVQGIIAGHGTPRVQLLEANARFAGAFAASEAAGADLAGQALNGLLGQPVDHARLTYQPGICLTKYVATLHTSSQEEQEAEPCLTPQ
jgi:carbamoyl-phosphate synthase large subunit